MVRNLIKTSGINLEDQFDDQHSYLDVFLEPTKLYVKPVLSVLDKVKVKAMSHITGGGFIENIPRAIPDNMDANIGVNTYKIPKIFKWLQEQGEIEATEMYNVFNMGIGFVLIVDQNDKDEVLNTLKEQNEEAYVIGEITKGSGNVNLSGVQL